MTGLALRTLLALGLLLAQLVAVDLIAPPYLVHTAQEPSR